jgi:recombination protein RecA
MSKALRKITGLLSKMNCTVIFINQIRMKIGVMYGNPQTTTGGEALKFYSSVRLAIRTGAKVEKDGKIIG